MPHRKISREELDAVVKMAATMLNHGKDKYHLARVLLYLYDRNQKLEDIRKKAEYYVRFGMGEQELRALRVALEDLRLEDIEEADESSFFAKE